MNYPDQHYRIVKDLLDGKFILQKQSLYKIIDNEYDFYKQFFAKSFKYELIKQSEFLYLRSDSTNEKFSRNIMLVLAVLIDNLNINHKDLSNIYQDYKIVDVENIIKNSSHTKVCRHVDLEKLIKKDCQKRNIIEFNNTFDIFKFTEAIKVFLDVAKEIANDSSHENNTIY